MPALTRRIFRRRFSRTTVAVLAFALVLVGGTVVWARWWNETHPEGLLASIEVMPVATQRLNFTDWSAIRTELEVLRNQEVKTMSTWLQEAWDRDLSPVSNMADTGVSMQKHFGFSPANAQWEAYGQAPSGQVEVVRLNDTVNFAAIQRLLTKAGYPKPSTANGIWAGGVDTLSGIDPSISAEFANMALFPNQHMVLASSSTSFLQSAIATLDGKQKSLKTVPSLTSMLDQVGEPAAARVWVRDYACADLAMSQADQSTQTAAQQAIAAAGQITPLVGFTLALQTDDVLTAAEQFTSPQVAQGDLKARAALATGPEYNDTGANFSDDFTLQSAQTQNSTILLNLKPNHPGVFPLSSLYSGPLIFATC